MIEEKIIDKDKRVKVTRMNHIIEVQYLSKVNNTNPILNIGNNEYVNKSTGEIKEYLKHEDTRMSHLNSMARTMKKLRYLINNNFIGSHKEIMLTITYKGKEPMRDPKKLYEDMDIFFKRFKRYVKKHFDSTIDYISVIEPQNTGSLHAHILVRINKDIYNYIPADDLRKMWIHGSINIKTLKGIDNIGAYLTAYLINVPVEEIENEKEPLNNGSPSKKIIKGLRLYYYPKDINIYRKSKGIKMPDREYQYYDKINEIKNISPTFTSLKKIELENTEDIIIKFEYYNLKRKIDK